VSGRRIRNFLLLALLAAGGYWYYRERPTASELVDGLTRPLLGSRAAVKESERQRVIGDAAAVISHQSDENVGMLRVGMTSTEVRELLGNPDGVESLKDRDPVRVRWVYRTAKRTVVFENARVVSIAIL
jgi:hypothetical protein